MFPEKICPKNEKLYIFKKSLTMPFQICKDFCKTLNNLIFNEEKLKICKFPLTGYLQKFFHFFRITCAIRFLMSKVFQKAKFYQNLTSGSGSKQRFSLLQEKAVIRPVLGLKGGLWVCRKSQKISTASDQYFLSYVKKTTGPGGNLTPPPAGIGLRVSLSLIGLMMVKLEMVFYLKFINQVND